MAVHVGDKLKNRYRIEESLGRGGMAEVYRVWDLQRNVPLAMKVLREDLAHDVVFLKRFEREAKTLSKLQHPNIVRFYGLEQDGMLVFMLMDYIEGESLREEIFRSRGNGMSLERILEIMHPVCSALNYAHQSGIVHCDLKPGNILIDKSGKIFISDFGIARHIDVSTSTMVGIGTPAYMAPELIKGEDPTPQTDIYALGIVLYEMLTGGERPFTGERATITGTTAEKVRWEHLELEPAPVSQFNPKVNPDNQAIVDRCLQKQPEMRFQNIQGLINSLNNLREDTDIQFENAQRVQEKCDRKNLVYSNPDEIQREKVNSNSDNSSDRPLFINGKEYVKREEGKSNNKKSKNPEIAVVLALSIGSLLLIGIPVAINNNIVHATQTAQAIARATMNAESTATAAFEATQAASFRATESYLWSLGTEIISELNEPIQLIEDDTDDYLECIHLEEMKNFILSTVISNPSDIANGFEYGILFRGYGWNDQYRLGFYDDGSWNLLNRVEDDSTTINYGTTTAFNGNSNSSNFIELIVNNNVGFLYVNQEFVSSLDLTDRYSAGDITVCTDLTNGYGKTGNSIRIDYLLLEQIIN